jgi:hypothetical protein
LARNIIVPLTGDLSNKYLIAILEAELVGDMGWTYFEALNTNTYSDETKQQYKVQKSCLVYNAIP